MTEVEKMSLLNEAFDVEDGDLTPDMRLDDIDEYDSMTKLALIVMISEKFGKTLTGSDIKSFVTVQDILNVMN